jgi:serine/threonine-protein kinase
MGVVHLGTMVSPAGQRRVAIKLLHTGKSSEAQQDLLTAEARLVFQLTHANICQVLDLAVNEQGMFIVMEFVDGLDLHHLLQRLKEDQKALEPAFAVFIVREIARALGYAHRRKDDTGRALWLVHGDVAPQNVLISREGEVKLADFGIARSLGGNAPGNRLRGGTPGFMAPELVNGGTCDHRGDIYSLGVVLYSTLVGTGKVERLDLDALRDRADIPNELVSILGRATAARPEARFASATEVEEQLSLHLARHYPAFTVPSLASTIQRYAERASSATETGPTLESVIFTSKEEALSNLLQSPPAQEMARPRTQRVPDSPRRVGRRMLLIAAALVLAAAGVIAWPMLHATRSTRIAASQDAATAPPSAPEVAPEPQKIAAPKLADAPRRTTSSPPHNVKKRPAKSEEDDGRAAFLTVFAEPWGAVWVDGKQVAMQTPLYKLPVAAGRHRIHVSNADLHKSSEVKVVDLAAGEAKAVGFRSW